MADGVLIRNAGATTDCHNNEKIEQFKDHKTTTRVEYENDWESKINKLQLTNGLESTLPPEFESDNNGTA